MTSAAKRVLHLRRVAARASEHEASSAARAAQRIVESAGVSERDVQAAEAEEIATSAWAIVKGGDHWHVIAARAATTLAGCDAVVRPTTGAVEIYLRGSERQRNAATSIYAKFERLILKTSPPPTPQTAMMSMGFGSFSFTHAPPPKPRTEAFLRSFRVGIAAGIERIARAHIERLNAPKPGAMVVRQPDAPPKLGLEDVEFDQEAVQLGAQMAANVGAFIESRVRESKL